MARMNWGRVRQERLVAERGADPIERSARGKRSKPVKRSNPVKRQCEATTANGEQCKNHVQRGERFCGPHLDQARRARRGT